MSEELTRTSKMATCFVTDVFVYALCRWTLMKALVGLLLLLMSVEGSCASPSHSRVPHTSVIDATPVSLATSGKSTVANVIVISGETVPTHAQTANLSSPFNKDFTKPELAQSASVSADFSENAAAKENMVEKAGTEFSLSSQRLTRSIDSKISAAQILENLALTSNGKDTSLESSDKNTDHTYTNEVDNRDGGKGVEYYRQIQPTKTISVPQDNRAKIVKTMSLDGRLFEGDTHSGEEYGAPRGRALSLTEPENPTVSVDGTKKVNATQIANELTRKEAETPGLPFASFRSNYDERKTNPDIQDIITGIVKLLNGNVKVQANPNLPPGGMLGAGRPLRPLTTRINNRGPPRITDVPPLPPDFDTSGPHPELSHHPPPLIPLQTSSRLPPPYPFDLPPAMVPLPPQPSEIQHSPDHPFMTGIPLPEQVVPISNSNNGKRPPGNQGIVRPQRPRLPRPRPSTKPNANINRRPQPTPSVGKDHLSLGIHKNPQAEENLPTRLTEDQGDQDDKEHEFTTPQPPATVQEEEEFATNTNTTTTKSQISSVDMQSFMSEEEVVPVTTDGTGNETPNETEDEQDKHTSSINGSVLNISREEPKIIATLTSSSSTVNEATQEALPVSSSEPAKTEEAVVSGGSTLEVPHLEPSKGVGVATPVLESSMQEVLTHDFTSSTEWDGHQSAATSAKTPTSFLPQSALSSSGAMLPGVISSSSSAQDKLKQTTGGFAYYPYRSRTGIVLDDTEYKPMGVTNRPIITAPAPGAGHVGDIFDVTVSAIQGPGGAHTGQPFIYPVEIEGVQLSGPADGEVSVITKAEGGQHFVSIDGKRTYLNLFGSSTEQGGVAPTRIQQGAHTLPPQKSASTIGTGFAVLEAEESASHHEADPSSPPQRRPYNKRPTHPPVRIDMCTVGDDSTCDSAQNEMCRTELGVSSCHCRPGYSRRKHREPCRRVVSILMSLRVDRLYDRRVVWDGKLQNPESEEYKTLEWESSRAIDSAMLMTPFSDDFMGVRVNGLYTVPGGAEHGGSKWGAVYVNLTLQLEESVETLRPAVRHDIQRHLLGVIHRRNNNVGHSALWVDSPPGSISQLQDVDECTSRELHDCHHQAQCSNVFGSFRCSCPEGYRDPWIGNPHRSGRQCETCSPEHCSSRGECRYEAGQPVCYCSSNFYGSQCEVDGEVLGVAVGASVAAVVIIVLTLVCLCMWSRRWSREQKTAAGMGSPVFGYMASGGSTVKTPAVGSPPYQVSLEDRLRWAQIADVMVQANHYAQPEPVPGSTRPSSAMFGYPSLTMSGTLPHGVPPVPLPRLGLTTMSHTGAVSVHGGTALSTLGALSSHGMRTPDRTVESTSSEEEDRADLLGRNFHVPRPKSRSSVANQSGIYYDVDFEQDVYSGTSKSQQAAIPMSTYTMSSRAPYYRQ